jgi:hypothetical protein
MYTSRRAVLEAQRDGDHERVLQAREGRALLGDVDEDVAGLLENDEVQDALDRRQEPRDRSDVVLAVRVLELLQLSA